MTETHDSAVAFEQLLEPRLAEIASLCRRLGVSRLDVFGSAVTGRFDPEGSDLDFLVEFEPGIVHRYAKACFELRTALEQLFGRPVDLLTEASLANPYLRHQIESEKRRLYPPS
jgi:predicted nucleotidyltransferase